MAEELTRREILEKGALGAAAVALSGVLASPAGARVRSWQRVGAKRKRSSLTVLEPVIAPGLDWDGRQGTNPGAQELMAQTYDVLVEQARVLRGDTLVSLPAKPVVPAMAQSFKKNGNEWTFRLRPGIKSAFGHSFTADDVVWTYARSKSLSGPGINSWATLNAASLLPSKGVIGPGATAATRQLAGEVVKVDNLTVKFTQFESNELFPTVLFTFPEEIVDSVEAKKHATADDPWCHNWMDTGGSAGFGAYYIHQWRQNEAILLRANPNFWRGKPQFTQVNISQVPFSSTRLTSVLTGAADVATGLSPHECARAAKSSKTKVLSFFGARNLMLSANYRAAPWDGGGDPQKQRLLRQALAYAIPYDEINKKGYANAARRWYNLVPSGAYAWKSYKGLYNTNLSKAKALLAEAGYPNGKGLDGPGLGLIFVAEQQSTLEPVATAIQTSLKQIGINITLNPIPQAQFSPRKSVAHDLPLWLDFDTISPVTDPGYVVQNLFLSVAKGGTVNATNYSSEELDTLYFQQRNDAGAKRRQELAKLQDILMRDLPRIPIVETPTQVVLSKDLTHWRPRMDKAAAGDIWAFITK